MLVALITGDEASPASFAILTFGVLAAIAVFIAGLRDYLRGMELPELNRWIESLKSSDVAWSDCYASADPVPNGVVAPSARDLSRTVCNLASMSSDHTEYWSNRDQFVSWLWDRIAASRRTDTLPDLRLRPEYLEYIGKRRRWRVSIGNTIRWLGTIGILTAIVREPQGLIGVGKWVWYSAAQLIPPLIPIDRSAPTDFAIGWAYLVLVPCVASRWLWTAWNNKEMRRQIDSADYLSEPPIVVIMCVVVLSCVVAGLALGRFPSFTVLFSCLLVPTLSIAVLDPQLSRRRARPEHRQAARGATATRAISSAEKSVSFLAALASLLAAPFSIGLLAWELMSWLVGQLADGSILGFRPDRFPSISVGVVAALLTLIAIVARVVWNAFKTPQTEGATR